jgi:DNA polymerase-3 subunit delta
MAVLREADLADFLKRKLTQFNGLLLFGNDEAAIAAAVRQAAIAFSQGEEPLRIDASSLRNDPAALDDAFRSMSLLGDRRLIVLSGVEETHLNVLAPILDMQALGNFVVLSAGSLKKTSKLRLAAEGSQRFGVIAFYEEAGAALVVRVQMIAKAHGMNFVDGAAERFVDLCGSDRMVLIGEAEKLVLYCHPAKEITLEDVEAICGDQAEFEADGLNNAVFDGDLETVDRMFSSMLLSGDGRAALIMLQLYLTRLTEVSAARDRGMDLASACRAARPPVFDKQQQTVGRHLRSFSGDDLARALVSVQQAILQSRQMADLGDAITSRCLLSLARMARQLRRQAA